MNRPSSTFCSLPWLHIYARPAGQMLTCCSGTDQRMGMARGSKWIELMNHPLMREVRQAMLRGEWHANCAICRDRESLGAKSSRTVANAVRNHLSDPQAMTLEDGTIENPELRHLELCFSNLCNFRCRYCNFSASSAWYDDQMAVRGRVELEGSDIPPDSKVVRAGLPMDELLRSLVSVRSIDFLGGEPLLEEGHVAILKELIRLRRFDVNLNYITNFSRLDNGREDFNDLWARFENLMFTVSLDGTGSRAEYIRKGLRWPTILKNFTKLRERAPKAHIGIHCTYSIYNAYHITDFHRWVMEDLQFEPRQFAVNMLVEPAHLRADILPTEFREPLIERLEAYDRFIPRAGLNLMRSSLQAPIKALTRARGRELDAQTKLKDFYAFNDKVDRLRGEIFERIFPEFLGMRRLASGCDPSPEA